MSLQTIISNIKTFFSYLFESLTMRTKPKYMPVYEEDEILYLNESMSKDTRLTCYSNQCMSRDKRLTL